MHIDARPGCRPGLVDRLDPQLDDRQARASIEPQAGELRRSRGEPAEGALLRGILGSVGAQPFHVIDGPEARGREELRASIWIDEFLGESSDDVDRRPPPELLPRDAEPPELRELELEG